MQPALKTRLIGAAVLVALAVIIVPMFFPGEPGGTGSQSISLDIPQTPDEELETRTMSVAPPPETDTDGLAEDRTGAAAGDTLARVEIPSRVPRDVGPGSGESPAPGKDAAAPSAAPEADASGANRPASKPEEKAPPAEKTSEKTAAAEPGRAAKGSYQVSLGAYASRANAERLMAKVRDMGYPVRLSGVQVGGKPAARVDAGPFDSRAAAESARLKLQAALPRAPANVVAAAADQPHDAPAQAEKAAPRAGGWAVQLVAYSKQSDANALRDRLRGAGFDGYVDSVKSGGNTLWRVRVGPQARRADAAALRERIKQKFPDLAGRIVSVP